MVRLCRRQVMLLRLFSKAATRWACEAHSRNLRSGPQSHRVSVFENSEPVIGHLQFPFAFFLASITCEKSKTRLHICGFASVKFLHVLVCPSAPFQPGTPCRPAGLWCQRKVNHTPIHNRKPVFCAVKWVFARRKKIQVSHNFYLPYIHIQKNLLCNWTAL